MKRIVFHIGGPAFHPVDQQARAIADWLGERFAYAWYDGVDAFDHLDDCDLLVLMGLHWTGMKAEWGGRMVYRPMQEKHQQAFRRYVASGRPLICHHGAIASYDDWPDFGGLIGFTWRWGLTTHSPFGDYTIRVRPTGHPVIQNISDYRVQDELYYNVQVAAEFNPVIHADVEWSAVRRPMVMTAEGGRIAGAGKVVYLANGHDMRAFECPALRQLWMNTVNWCWNG